MQMFNSPTRSTPAPFIRQARSGRHGVASLMAMLYLVVFSALALGFYAATTTASQVAANERTSLAAQLAAESGIGFLRYHLSALDINANTLPTKILEEVYQQLRVRLDGTPNLGGSAVGYDGSSITIPETGYVSLDRAGAQKFRIIVTQVGDLLEAKIIGRGGTVTIGRGIDVKFQKANNATAIFNYGVASMGSVYTGGTSTITGLTDPTKGSILSTSTVSNPVTVMGKTVSGDISTVNPDALVTFGSGVSIGGTNNTQMIRQFHIHKGVPEPRFPDINTAVYEQYARNPYIAGMKVLDNVRIPSGTGTPAGVPGPGPLVLDSVTIKGVLYIEGSNYIEFKGNTNIQGAIVTANNIGLNTSRNVLYFSGSVTAQAIDTLPVSYGDERNLTGAFIIAPAYKVQMFGNFGTVSGSIISGQFQMGGSAEGTVMGSIIQMGGGETRIEGSADVVIASTGTTKYPAGVTFGIHYTNVPGSYFEFPVTPAQ